MKPTDIIEKFEERQQLQEKRKETVRAAIKDEIQKKISNNKTENLYYEKFKKITQGEKYVKLEHIDALGLEYDVLFLTTIKNTGKTRNIVFNRFYHYYLKGQKVVYIRNTVNEIEKHMKEFNDSEFNPFLLVHHRSGYKLIDKKNKEDCGICVDMKNANSISGGEFKDYGAIIFDEAIPWSSNNIINDAHIANFFVLPSSIQRNKKEKIKVYLLSNVPSTKKNLKLLEELQLDLDENLRYIVRENPQNPEVNCKILYINAENLYGGINAQDGAAQMANQTAKLLISSNKLISSYDNTIGTDLFDFLTSKFAFIFTDRHKDYILHLKYVIDYDTNKEIYCVAGRLYDPSIYVDAIIYTDSRLTQTMYGKIIKYVPSIKWYQSYLMILMRQKKLTFANDVAVEVSRLLYDTYLKENPLLF